MPSSSSTSPTPKKLGTLSLVVFVLGAAAPLTVLVGFVPLGLAAGGEGVVAGFLIPSLVYLVFIVGFSAMSRHFDGAGAFYAYISRGLSTAVGSASGVVSYVGYLAGQIGFTASAAVFAGASLWSHEPAPSWIWLALGFTVVVTVLCHRSVQVGARVLVLLLTAEVAVLVVFCVAVLLKASHTGVSLHAFSPEVVFSVAVPSVLVLTFTAFVGFEQAAIYSAETKNPRRTVSRASLIAVTTLGLGYTFCTWVIVQAVGPEHLAGALAGDPSALVFALNDQYAGTVMTSVMRVLIITSFFAGILALQNACSRYLLALARGKIAPQQLGRIGATTGTPTTANRAHALIVTLVLVGFALFGANPYTQIVVWVSTMTVVVVMSMQILTSIAVVRFFNEDRRSESRWATRIAPTLAVILLIAALGLLLSQIGALTGLGTAGGFALLGSPLVAVAAYGFGRARWLERTRIHSPGADLPESPAR